MPCRRAWIWSIIWIDYGGLSDDGLSGEHHGDTRKRIYQDFLGFSGTARSLGETQHVGRPHRGRIRTSYESREPGVGRRRRRAPKRGGRRSGRGGGLTAGHVRYGLAGVCFITVPFRLEAPASQGGIAAPAAYPRIELVQARLDTWDVTIKPGAESASPSPLSPVTSCFALAELYLRPGMTGVLDADDGVNGYIRDVRTYV